jgi:hypothetical protein
MICGRRLIICPETEMHRILNNPLTFLSDVLQHGLALIEDLAIGEPHPSPLLRGEGADFLALWERLRVSAWVRASLRRQ